jgi:glycosyltransferase involved in cell wall biosynthesis
MMQIAINGRFLVQATTGVQRVAREFTKALDALVAAGELTDLKLRLLVPPGVAPDALPLRAITVEPVGRFRAHSWEQLSLPAALRPGEILLNLGNTAPISSLLSSQPTVVMVHDLSHRVFPHAYRRRYRLPHAMLDRLVLQRADLIITVAQTERAHLQRIMPGAASRIVVAPNGGWSDTDNADILPARDPAVPPYGLYVGSLSRRKNVDRVIASAVALARKRGLPFRIVGAANPILTAIRTTVPSDVAPLIEFRGQMEDVAALKAIYRDAAVLLFPSLYEASALPPIEAMAQGCPVVASNIQSLIERCGDAALYCDPDDVASITAAVERVLDERELAARLRRNGRMLAGQLTWRAQVETVVAALARLGGDIVP